MPHGRGTLAAATPERAEATLPAGAKVTLGIRPEHVQRVPAGAVGPRTGRASHVEQLGEACYLDPLSRDGVLTVRQGGDTAVVADDAVLVTLPECHCQVFGPDGRAVPRHLPASGTVVH